MTVQASEYAPVRRTAKKQKNKAWSGPSNWVVGTVSVASGLVAWWLATDVLRLLSPLFLPSPFAVIEAARKMIESGEMAEMLKISLFRAGVGYMIGATIGMCLGVVAGWWRLMGAAVSPYVAAFYPIPKIALLPLFILWLGIGETSKIFLIVFGTFYYTFVSSMTAVRNVNPVLVKAMKSMECTPFQMFSKSIVWDALPGIMTGYKLAAGGALLLLVPAEMLGAHSGLGYMLLNAGQLLQTDRLFVGLIILAILGMILYNGLDILERKLAPWKH